jgi:hypothetical protein
MAKKPNFPHRPCPKCQKPIHIKSKKHEACGWSAEDSASKAASSNGQAETTSGYFRMFFKENPKLLKERSNAVVLEKWLADHPGAKEVPDAVKQSLSNIKSILRSKKRKRRKAKAEASAVAAVPTAAAVSRPKASSLETLEEQIDDCLTFAKQTDREGLETVIRALRSARNSVVWKMGQ